MSVLLGIDNPIRYGLIWLVLALLAVNIVSCERVYLSATGSPNWDGACSGCNETSPCFIGSDLYALDGECEVVLMPGRYETTPTLRFYHTAQLNITSLGQKVELGSLTIDGAATSNTLLIYDLDLEVIYASAIRVDFGYLHILDSRFTKQTDISGLFRVNNNGEMFLFTATNSTFIYNSDSDVTATPMFASSYLPEAIFDQVRIDTSRFVLQGIAPTKSFIVRDSHISGSFISDSTRFQRLTIERTYWINSVERFWSSIPSISLDIVDSTLINHPDNTLDFPWAQMPGEALTAATITNSSIIGFPMIMHPSTLHIENCIFDQTQSAPTLATESPNLAIINSSFHRNASLPSSSVVNLGINSRPDLISLKTDVLNIEGSHLEDGMMLNMGPTVEFEASEHALNGLISLPSILLQTSLHEWNTSNNNTAVRFTGDMKSTGLGSEGSEVKLSGYAFIFDSIKVYDVSFDSHIDTHLVYHVTNMTAGCIELITTTENPRPFFVIIREEELFMDFSDQDFHSFDTLPQIGDEYPLFKTSQNKMALTDVSGQFNLTYSLDASNQAFFSFGTVPCNVECDVNHIDGICVHPTICGCLDGWRGPLCDCPSERWIDGSCAAPSPSQSPTAPKSEPTSQAPSQLEISASATLLLLLVLAIF